MQKLKTNKYSFVVCVTYCHKCRTFKKLHPEVNVIELRNSVEGLGDILSIITYALHIPHCFGCERRRNLLNDWFPLKSLIPQSYRIPEDKPRIRKVLKRLNIKKYPVLFRWNRAIKNFIVVPLKG